jgi:hypothetical protein
MWPRIVTMMINLRFPNMVGNLTSWAPISFWWTRLKGINYSLFCFQLVFISRKHSQTSAQPDGWQERSWLQDILCRIRVLRWILTEYMAPQKTTVWKLVGYQTTCASQNKCMGLPELTTSLKAGTDCESAQWWFIGRQIALEVSWRTIYLYTVAEAAENEVSKYRWWLAPSWLSFSRGLLSIWVTGPALAPGPSLPLGLSPTQLATCSFLTPNSTPRRYIIFVVVFLQHRIMRLLTNH